MNKIFSSMIVLAFLLMPQLVDAASGACSGHGGVSCAAGSDSDGSVICEDGWRNSSVSYSSMVKCEGYSSAPVVESEPDPQPEPEPEPIPTMTTSGSTTIVVPVVTPEPEVEVSTQTFLESEPVAETTSDESDQEVDTSAQTEVTTEAPVVAVTANEPTESSAAAGIAVLSSVGGIGYGIYRGVRKILF